MVDESYPGDIVGLHDTGNFKIGDTLTEGEVLNFKGIPSFSPEHFRYINNADPMRAKQLSKGIDQLMDEGVAQLFTLDLNGRKISERWGRSSSIVIQYRLEHEYNALCTYEAVPVYKACWIEAEDPAAKSSANSNGYKTASWRTTRTGARSFWPTRPFPSPWRRKNTRRYTCISLPNSKNRRIIPCPPRSNCSNNWGSSC